MAPKPPKPAQIDEDDTAIAGTALRGLALAVANLTRCVEVTTESMFTDGDHGTHYNPDMADHLGALSRHLSLIVDSSRKAEAERRKAADISPRQISEYIRRSNPEQRAQMHRELAAADKKRSGLA